MIKGRITNQQTLTLAISRMANLDFAKPLVYNVRLEEESHTDAQRRLFWKWMGECAEQLGFEKDDMGYEMKERFLPSIQRRLMNGATADERKSLTKLGKKDMAEFMDRVSRFCHSECGVVLTHPEDAQRR